MPVSIAPALTQVAWEVEACSSHSRFRNATFDSVRAEGGDDAHDDALTKLGSFFWVCSARAGVTIIDQPFGPAGEAEVVGGVCFGGLGEGYVERDRVGTKVCVGCGGSAWGREVRGDRRDEVEGKGGVQGLQVSEERRPDGDGGAGEGQGALFWRYPLPAR